MGSVPCSSPCSSRVILFQSHRVWDIDGQYCCVPDKQVGKALERWHYIDSYNSNLITHMECSKIVWNHFHEMYDFPVLHYARTHWRDNRDSDYFLDLCDSYSL